MSEYYYRHTLPRSQSALSGTKSKKRKRDDDSQDDADSISSTDSEQPRASHSSWAEFTAKDVIQRKTAGLSPGEAIPDSPFPNRPADHKIRETRSAAPSVLQRELSNLQEPLIDHVQRRNVLQKSASSLRQQHITVLYTLLHRCLLDRDYIRAGRAFGLLLRTESLGQLPELRKKNLWGIGAEILLGRKSREAASTNPANMRLYPTGDKDAREYYERLIIQFPYRINAPHALSAVHLYPVLIGLWIMSVERKHRNATKSIRDSYGLDQEGNSSQTEELEYSRRKALTEAQAILQRMEETMRSIPYCDDSTLWRLKGHIFLWIHDLSISYHDTSDHQSMHSADSADLPTSAQNDAYTAFATAAAFEQASKSQHVEHGEAEEG